MEPQSVAGMSRQRIDRILYLLVGEGMTFAQIGEELGISTQAVRGLINRQKIRERVSHPRPMPAFHDTLGKRPAALPAPPDRAIAPPSPVSRQSKPVDCTPATFVELLESDPQRLRCRFPIEGEGRAMTCCGAPVADPGRATGLAGSYCAYHLRASDRRQGGS